jgi:hypothetical protein
LKFAFKDRSSGQLSGFNAHGEDYAMDMDRSLRIIRYFAIMLEFLACAAHCADFCLGGGFARGERLIAIQRITNASYFHDRDRRGISDR